jgi:hypothetical protein
MEPVLKVCGRVNWYRLVTERIRGEARHSRAGAQAAPDTSKSGRCAGSHIPGWGSASQKERILLTMGDERQILALMVLARRPRVAAEGHDRFRRGIGSCPGQMHQSAEYRLIQEARR